MKKAETIAKERIDDIMRCFDFKKVHRFMQLVNWKWSSSDAVPNEDALRATAKELLEIVACDEGWTTETGGFRAENHFGALRLSFVLEGWDAGYDEPDTQIPSPVDLCQS
jgi:hypothetical protein